MAHESVAPLIEIYKLNTQLFQRTLDDISEQDIKRRPADGGNSLLFVAGHVASSRFTVSRIAGLREESPWGQLFGRGTSYDESTDFPSITDIKGTWADISDKLIRRLTELAEANLKATPPFDVPVGDKTVLGAIAFFALHDSYHIGQFAYIRRLLGYGQLVG